jgi:S-layer protein
MTDATGTADNFNIVTKVTTADTNVGTVAAAGVEKIVVTASDTLLDNDGNGTNDAVSTSTLTLKDAALTNVTVNGNANLVLSLDNNVVALTSVDASALTGVLTATTNGTVAQTITGGSGKDILTSKSTGTVADKLIGGDGADTLTANKGLSQMTGGAGNDIFKIDVASTNSNSAATITDAASGDFIVFANADAFKSAAIELDSTAVFQDFANAAIASITSDNDLAWFQFAGNTYIVQEKNTGTNADVFTNNEDFIVKITGTIDLSTASFNLTSHTLQLA